MGQRANPSGIQLTERDAATVKGMLARGDRQHDIAAWFGVNGGRIAEIATGKKFGMVIADKNANLPPPGPYPNGRDALTALTALRVAKQAILAAEAMVATQQR
ncbi:MAG: hypothetical protein RL481_2371 [Pseudomonadota bacterium]